MRRQRGLSLANAALLPDVVERFGEGASMASLASRYRVTVQTVERLIRRAMMERRRDAKESPRAEK